MQDERIIIEQVLNGNKNAFEELVVANQKNVYNLALKMTKNAEDALDISQEAFIKAYRNLQNFRGDSKFSVWLYRLTYNICIDFLRKKSKENVISLDYEDDSGTIAPIEIPDVKDLPEDSLVRKEVRRTIAQSIAELPQKHSEVLIMREVNSMSYEEIAETLLISVGTVKSRIARARVSLAEILVKKGTFPANYRHTE
ncbi:MAG: sigma-70 family RNA polymerase sigma factor [Oscillospiraceae bacterium]|nr:sigma-70 family RNA polymerase sigma factor [Oscillospiraceae bacterium]